MNEEKTITIKERILQWIKWWGNGGGCLSLENWISEYAADNVPDDCESIEEAKTILKENPPGYLCDSLYEGFIDEMLDDIK